MSRNFWFGPTGQALDLDADMHRIVALAHDVAIERAATVCAAMYRTAAARSLHHGPPFGQGAAIRCVAAAVQDRTGGEGFQAAHLLPGTITVAGRPVWQIVPDTSPALRRLAAQLEAGFALTALLPAAVNRADSVGEADHAESPLAGLKSQLAARVQQLWNGGVFPANQPLVVDRQAVHTALAGWFRDLNHVYAAAAVRKRRAAEAAKGTDRERSARRRTEARVLETYAAGFVVANVARFVESHAQAVAREFDGR
jgi:antitoxin (DNA-binding transcriptional repressor) of toxin-antitoxin stability system